MDLQCWRVIVNREIPRTATASLATGDGADARVVGPNILVDAEANVGLFVDHQRHTAFGGRLRLLTGEVVLGGVVSLLTSAAEISEVAIGQPFSIRIQYKRHIFAICSLSVCRIL